MKIYTDASSNDARKITAISCVCVSDDNELIEQRGLSFFSKDVHFAELYAIRYAIQIAAEMGVSDVKVYSDSNSALYKMNSYFGCLKKEPSKRGPSIMKFFTRLGNKHGPLLKKALDRMVDIIEKHPSIKFSLAYVHGHQKPKKVLKTEEEWHAYWNDCADKFVDEVRQMGENENANVYVAYKEDDRKLTPTQVFGRDWNELSAFINKDEMDTQGLSERIVGQAHPLTNVSVKYYVEPKLIEKKEKKENRNIRTISYHPRKNPGQNRGRGRDSRS